MTPIALLFAAGLLGALTLKLWLGYRQIRFVGRRAGEVPAAFSGSIGPDEHRRAANYAIARQRLALGREIVSALGFVALTWLGGVRFFYDRMQGWVGAGLAFDMGLVACAIAFMMALEMPFDWIRCFRIEQRFGFNRMTQAMFFADAAKSLCVGAILGLPLLAAVLELMRSAGPLWWIAAWIGWAAFSLTLAVLYPVLIAPLFNRFTPLPDDPLRRRIAALLARTGFRSSGVYTMDGSRRSAHGNAYFTGLGAAKRIVFYDTLIESLYPEEIEAVLAHELGHFRRHHVTKRIVSSLALALVALGLLAWLRSQAWFAPALGVPLQAGLPSDGLTLLLFGLVLPMLSLPFAPLQSALSRRDEFEADAFAAEHSSANSLVSALVKLCRDNAATLTPDPLHSAFYDSHPPASIRIDRLLAQAAASPS
jgi:STE24 endopeptidase